MNHKEVNTARLQRQSWDPKALLKRGNNEVTGLETRTSSGSLEWREALGTASEFCGLHRQLCLQISLVSVTLQHPKARGAFLPRILSGKEIYCYWLCWWASSSWTQCGYSFLSVMPHLCSFVLHLIVFYLKSLRVLGLWQITVIFCYRYLYFFISLSLVV